MIFEIILKKTTAVISGVEQTGNAPSRNTETLGTAQATACLPSCFSSIPVTNFIRWATLKGLER